MPNAERTSLARARSRAPDREPSLADALERLVLASQQMLSDRIGLAILDLHGAVRHALRGALVAGLAVGLALGGWFALVAAAVSAATPRFSLPVVLSVAGIANVAAGVGLALVTLRGDPPRDPGAPS